MICGGAGYVGAHMLKMFALQGHDVVVFDNLSTGHHAAVRWGSWSKTISWILLRWNGYSAHISLMWLCTSVHYRKWGSR
nr:NAD-dependent epimerase/dehydratase family protein [Dyella flava]